MTTSVNNAPRCSLVDNDNDDVTITADQLKDLAESLGLNKQCKQILNEKISSAETSNGRKGVFTRKSADKIISDLKTDTKNIGCDSRTLKLENIVINTFNIACKLSTSSSVSTVTTSNNSSISINIEDISDNLQKIVDNLGRDIARLTESEDRYYEKMSLGRTESELKYIYKNLRWPGENLINRNLDLRDSILTVNIENITASITSNTDIKTFSSFSQQDETDVTADVKNIVYDKIDSSIENEFGYGTPITLPDNIKSIINTKKAQNDANISDSVKELLTQSTVTQNANNVITLNLTRPIKVNTINLEINSTVVILATQLTNLADSLASTILADIRDTTEYKSFAKTNIEGLADVIAENNKAQLDTARKLGAVNSSDTGALVFIIIGVVALIILGIGGYLFAKSKGMI